MSETPSLSDQVKQLGARLVAACQRYQVNGPFTKAATAVAELGFDANLYRLNLTVDDGNYSNQEQCVRRALQTFKRAQRAERQKTDNKAVQQQLDFMAIELGHLEGPQEEQLSTQALRQKTPQARRRRQTVFAGLSWEALLDSIRNLKEGAKTMRNKLLATLEEHSIILSMSVIGGAIGEFFTRIKDSAGKKLEKLAKALVILDATAPGVTITAAVLAVVTAVVTIIAGQTDSSLLLLLVPVLLGAGAALSVLDTLIAKQTNTATPYNTGLKEVCLQVSEVVVLLGFALSDLIYQPAIVAAIILVLLNNHFQSVVAKATGKERDESSELMNQKDRLLMLSGGCTIAALFNGIFGGGGSFMLELFTIFIYAGLILNIGRNARRAYAELHPRTAAPNVPPSDPATSGG